MNFDEKKLNPSTWTKFCEYLGLCPYLIFHYWKFNENQYQRTCQKCYLRQRYCNGDMPFDSGWHKE